jgi:hypothetical protein
LTHGAQHVAALLAFRRVPRDELTELIRADRFDGFGIEQRGAQWRRLPKRSECHRKQPANDHYSIQLLLLRLRI